MSLRVEQSLFARDVHKLLAFVWSFGLEVTLGEVQRPLEMQQQYIRQGRSKTMNSQHIKKLAIDLFFFTKDGQLIWNKEVLQPIGEYWESLDAKNSWGGNWKSFKDVPHFERRL